SPVRRKTFVVRQMEGPQEVQLALDWGVQEGWNTGLYDAECFYAADPEGFFLGLLGGEPIAAGFAVIYNDFFAFFGGDIVRPEYRGQGYGMRLIQVKQTYVGRRNIGLDAVPGMAEKYMRLGFREAFRNVRYEAKAVGQDRPGIVDLRRIPFREVAAYDTVHFGAARVGFLRRWINQPDSFALGAIRQGRLAGFGVVRPCRRGYRIGPLFADAPDIADDLYLALCHRVAGKPVALDTPQINPEAVALAERHKMKPVREATRMYLKGMPELPLDHIFGVTSFELG
ncbi:MAG TPA: GNAT family N-acetyltransferase, partial [Thermoguttaceae bacterium]|nr:GNAT family N-acetyltransferase [Thermoguttaceae bacterium]